MAEAKVETLDAKLLEAFRKVNTSVYVEQAKFYLNAFWTHGADAEAEFVWKTVHQFIDTDEKKKKGNRLNEVLSHHFLQKSGQTMTALELRREMRKIDLDADGEMALTEYLVFKHNRTVKELINNPQGGEANAQELKDATDQLEALSKAAEDLDQELKTQKEMEIAAKKAEAASKTAEGLAVAAEKEARAAEADALTQEELATSSHSAATSAEKAATAAADAAKAAEELAVKGEIAAKTAESNAIQSENVANQAALVAKDALEKQKIAEAALAAVEADAKQADAELEAQKKAYQGKIDELTAKANDANLSTVAKSKAGQELAILKSQDPLPLQKARITSGAVVRKVTKAREAATAETKIAQDKAADAEKTKSEAEQSRAKAESSRKQAEQARQQATEESEAAKVAADKAKEAAKKAKQAKDAATAARQKAQDDRAKAVQERELAEAARKEAESSREKCETQTKMVEAHLEDVKRRMAEAEASLAELKKKAAIPHGSIWWMEREIKEKKSYLPKSQQ